MATANGQLYKGLGTGDVQAAGDLVLTDTDGTTVLFKVAKATGVITAPGVSSISTNLSLSGTLAVTGATTLTGNAALGGTLAVTGASTLAAVAATTVAASGRIDSTVAAGSPVLKAILTNATPTVAFGADASHNPSTAPAGYLQILVGSTAYYIPVWA